MKAGKSAGAWSADAFFAALSLGTSLLIAKIFTGSATRPADEPAEILSADLVRAIVNDDIGKLSTKLQSQIANVEARKADTTDQSDIELYDRIIKGLESERDNAADSDGDKVDLLYMKYTTSKLFRDKINERPAPGSPGSTISTPDKAPFLDFSDMKHLTDPAINAFISRLNLKSFTKVSHENIQKNITLALNQTFDALRESIPFTILSATPDLIAQEEAYLKELVDLKEGTVDDDLTPFQALSGTPGFISAQNERAKLVARKAAAPGQIPGVKKRIANLKEIQVKLGAFRSKIIGDGVSSAGAEKDKIGTFGKFAYKYRQIVNEISRRLDPARVESLRRQPPKLPEPSGAVTKPGVAVSVLNQNQEGLLANIETDNQLILHDSAKGKTNSFGDHQPWDQILSILDILRDEPDNVSFETNVTASQDITAKNRNSNAEACKKILSKFPPGAITAMKAALTARKLYNKVRIGQESIKLSRTQALPQFKFMSLFTGFKGIALAVIPFGDLYKNFDFDATYEAAGEAIKQLRRINLSDLGLPYGNLGAKKLKMLKSAQAVLYEQVEKASKSVNWKAELKKLSDEDLKKCPELAALKNLMENPEGVATIQLDPMKADGEKATKTVKKQIKTIQGFTKDNENIDAVSGVLDGVFNTQSADDNSPDVVKSNKDQRKAVSGGRTAATFGRPSSTSLKIKKENVNGSF